MGEDAGSKVGIDKAETDGQRKGSPSSRCPTGAGKKLTAFQLIYWIGLRHFWQTHGG